MKSNKYQKQIVLPEIGANGQEKLSAAKVLIVGLGGLGSPVAYYLCAAGIGTIGICDSDTVAESNLHRQILYTENEIGKLKIDCAHKKLSALNSDCRIIKFPFELNQTNIQSIMSEFDMIVDGTDNFETKFLMNDYCLKNEKPYVYASIAAFDGEVAIFSGKNNSSCFRCLHPEPPKSAILNCDSLGVIGALAGVIGSIQALEVIKYLAGHQENVGKIIFYDSLRSNFRSMLITKNKNCRCSNLLKNDLKEIREDLRPFNISVEELVKKIESERFILLDVRNDNEWILGHIESAIHWPLQKIINGDFPAVINGNYEKDIVLYCHSGVRSRVAQEHLIDAGFSNTKNLSRGIVAWTKNLVKPKQ